MERFNPFANSSAADELDSPINSPANFSSPASQARQASSRAHEQLAGSGASGRYTSTGASAASTSIIVRGQQQQQQPASAYGGGSGNSSRYSTSFPDPFGDSATIRSQHSAAASVTSAAGAAGSTRASSRSNSVTFATPTSCSVDELQQSPTRLAGSASPRAARGPGGATPGASGFTSFLSRATSVTSSSVTDRVSGAVGSVRSAVDLLSNQFQQAVPSSLMNERLSSTSNPAETGGSSQAVTFAAGSQQATSADPQQQQQQQQSAASYLASKISSATNQFVGSSSGQSSSSLPVISRQRVILILESPDQTNWMQQFKNYRRLTSGQSATSSTQSALTSFFSSATAQLTSSTFTSNSSLASPSCGGEVIDGDLVIEQADFRDVSVLANQSSSTVTIRIANQSSSHPQYGSTSSSNASSSSSMSQRPSLSQLKDDPYYSRRSNSAIRIVRPEYVIVKQRTRERLEHLRKIVTALNYCLVPMFEPFDVWSTFQDRQLIFARLLRVQKTLGKENFPLIPQIYCQTHLDLLNYLNNTSSVTSLPCLVRTSGPLGKGKIKIDNLQMLKDFACIVATSGLSCTIEQYLDVKCDLIVQKLGTSLKLFRKVNSSNNSSSTSSAGGNESSSGIGKDDLSSEFTDSRDSTTRTNDHSTFTRQQATRQTSIGSSVLSNFISGATQQSSSLRRSSNPVATNNFERLSEVNFRYKNWVDAISREFSNQLQAFCVKIVVAGNDREYVVGFNDCSMEFLGNSDNQEEDKRSFVELIISNVNTLLPKTNLSRESSSNMTPTSAGQATRVPRRSSSDDKTDQQQHEYYQSTIDQDRVLGDKRKFTSQSQINGSYQTTMMHSNGIHHSGGGGVGRGQVGSGAPAPRSYGQLSNRSQSVSGNQSDYLMTDQTLNKSAYYGRRGSDRSDSDVHQQQQQSPFGSFSSTNPLDYTNSNQIISPGSNASSLHHQRQSSLGQSLLDQTSTAFSSLHKQSIGFFKRLDSRGGDIVSCTPPQSAKSDIGFDRSFMISAKTSGASSATGDSASGDASAGPSTGRNGFKSQSVDSSSLRDSSRPGGIPTGGRRRETPPKPPPPHPIGNRQSSLASYSTQRPSAAMSTPSSTRQNSENISDSSKRTTPGSTQRGRVLRQNSALSAFEPYEQDIAAQLGLTDTNESPAKQQQPTTLDRSHPSDTITGAASMSSVTGHQAVDKPYKSLPDSASVTSGDSNSTGDTTSAEDTMNNLKKTFASIFGDKCE